MMRRLCLGLVVATLVAGCEKQGGTPPVGGSEGPAPAAVPAVAPGGTSAAPATLPVVEDAAKQVETAKEAMDKTVADVEKAAGELEGKASETVAQAKEQVEEALEAADPSVSVEQLKGMVSSLSGADLTSLADKLLGSIGKEDGLVKDLEKQVAELGIGDVLKAPELKKQLENALGNLAGLKEKLSLVVDRLKASGLDVSKYTALLGGS